AGRQPPRPAASAWGSLRLPSFRTQSSAACTTLTYSIARTNAGKLPEGLHSGQRNQMDSFDAQLSELKRGVQDLLLEQDLVRKLKRGIPLRVKAGFDPTAPDLHLGHTVVLNKMREFQRQGHEVIFLI